MRIVAKHTLLQRQPTGCTNGGTELRGLVPDVPIRVNIKHLRRIQHTVPTAISVANLRTGHGHFWGGMVTAQRVQLCQIGPGSQLEREVVILRGQPMRTPNHCEARVNVSDCHLAENSLAIEGA